VQKAKQRFAAFGLLRLPDYRWAFISIGLLTFGYQMRSIAQSWLALELTDSQAWVGIVNGVPALAVIVLSLVGGIASDRFPKRDILIWVRAGLAILSFTVGYLVVAGWIQTWHLVVLALAQGSIVAFGMPAGTAIVVEIVGRPRLLPALSLNQSLQNLGVIAGPALGGVLIGMMDVGPVYLVVGGVYVLAAVTTFLIKSRKVVERDHPTSSMSGIMEGLRYVRNSPVLGILLALNLTGLSAAFVMPLIPLYARDILRVGETGFGSMMASFGAGSLVGALSLTIAGNVRRKGVLIVCAGLFWATGMIVFGFSRHFWLSIITLFVMGLAAPIYVTSITALAQSVIDDQVRGRVTSLFTITMQLFSLGWLIGGALAVWIGNETTLIIGGTATCAAPIIAYILHRGFRQAS
jgi:MFS family permease